MYGNDFIQAFYLVIHRTVAFAALTFLSVSAAQAEFKLTRSGLDLYNQNCAECHGADGSGTTGNTNLQIGNFKFRTTGPGNFPSREDILRVIEEGIPNMMPANENLSRRNKNKLADLVQQFAALPKFDEPISIIPQSGESDITRGHALFSELGCVQCHGEEGLGDGVLANELEDSNGDPIRPANLAKGEFKGGNSPEDIWHRINSGLDGTPMPAFGYNVDDQDIWALVNYVTALQDK